MRYIGASKNPEDRLRHHVKPSANQYLPIVRWVRKLQALGLRPALIIIEECSGQAWKEAERWWIATWKTIAPKALLNLAAGGRGGGTGRKGIALSEAHRNKIGRALRGRTISAKTRAKISRSQKGKPETAVAKAAISTAHPWRDKERPQQSEAMKRHYQNPEARKKTGEASKRIWRDPTIRAKLLASRQFKLGHKHSSITKGRIRVSHITRRMRIDLYGE